MIKTRRYIRFPLRITETLHDGLRTRAFETRRSMNDLILEFVESGLRQDDQNSNDENALNEKNEIKGWLNPFRSQLKEIKVILRLNQDKPLTGIAVYSTILNRDFILLFEEEDQIPHQYIHYGEFATSSMNWPRIDAESNGERPSQFFFSGELLWASDAEKVERFNRIGDRDYESTPKESNSAHQYAD